jgi:GxxExxY protein
MIVDDKVVVETKAGPELPSAAKRQILNYLRATNLEVGLVLHFGLEARFHRLVSSNKGAYPPDPPNSRNQRSPL